ncbi:malignant T-cell-amplified sequence 1 homolog isoform X2 [Vespula pensylvanica]|uniref:malignant T-cell-amplified sequence 1 homolog isoform X2 n=1 Tax=Vespula pensylvanica TaxID=30213 RepID=UPI001CB9F015|nr:malignant T-cell-amplified sequence 1 homolog isoform X2 [Vespula pensylvanica]XP_050866439.1 malignant T-cell-amplified sequence 1 homolog isoform X2 [Vespula vulgaris]
MFKKFDEKDSVSGIQQLKSSVQKGIRSKLLDLYPHLESHVDTIIPKKDAFRIVKCHDHIEIIVNAAGELLFFRQREGPWMPTLRLLHKYPFFLPMEQVDKGAIRFVLSGANIMCPGLTSKGAKMTPVEKGTVVYELNKQLGSYGRREAACFSSGCNYSINRRYSQSE